MVKKKRSLTKKTDNRIRFGDLVILVQRGKITKADYERYFCPVYDGYEPFKPSLAINEANVDIAGVERTARAAGPMLGFEASEIVKRAKAAAAPEAMAAAAPIAILAEGDSWFNLPSFFLFPDTLIDKLQATRPIRNIAMWGDELDEMILAAEYIPHLQIGEIQFLLISGGGNDALGGGSLSDFLRQRRSGDNDPDNASRYIRPEFFNELDRLERLYGQFAENVLRISPSTFLVLHGYDYAIPRRDGPWLGRELEFRGFHPVFQKELARALIRLMIDAFNARLRTLHNNLQNVIYLNLRNTVTVNGWFDELHPKSASAQKLANKYKVLLDKPNPKTGPVPIV